MARKGMVDALEEAHRVLVPGGILVDARPDSTVRARVRARGRLVGAVGSQRETKTDDRMSDRAVRDVVRRRLFRSMRRGRIWHGIPFKDRAELQQYLNEHLRFSRRVTWNAPAARRSGPLVLDRAIRFEVLERS